MRTEELDSIKFMEDINGDLTVQVTRKIENQLQKAYHLGINHFKSALREELETMSDPQNFNGAHPFDDGQVFAYKEVLELIEKLTPNK